MHTETHNLYSCTTKHSYVSVCLRSYSKAKFYTYLSLLLIESRLFTMAMECWDECSENDILYVGC
jgi:hypothetical protein